MHHEKLKSRIFWVSCFIIQCNLLPLILSSVMLPNLDRMSSCSTNMHKVLTIYCSGGVQIARKYQWHENLFPYLVHIHTMNLIEFSGGLSRFIRKCPTTMMGEISRWITFCSSFRDLLKSNSVFLSNFVLIIWFDTTKNIKMLIYCCARCPNKAVQWRIVDWRIFRYIHGTLFVSFVDVELMLCFLWGHLNSFHVFNFDDLCWPLTESRTSLLWPYPAVI